MGEAHINEQPPVDILDDTLQQLYSLQRADLILYETIRLQLSGRETDSKKAMERATERVEIIWDKFKDQFGRLTAQTATNILTNIETNINHSNFYVNGDNTETGS